MNMQRAKVLIESKKQINSVKEAIAEGIATESITIAYYEDILKYSKDKTVETLKVLIAEEEEHLEKLKKLYELQ